ncbi:MAG: hypothetical protein JWN40_3697 [Phycisphaerales bacterium]|nr:hypothetical protein [Phycisphaerales bacterium]
MSRLYNNPGDAAHPAVSGQVRSTASVIAIVCAFGSFYLASRQHQLFGFILALVAIGAGLIGGLRALSPKVSGGILSIIAVALGAIAIVYSLLALVF